MTSKHPQIVAYVDSLQRKNAEALSFYPKQTFEREAERGRILLSILEGEPCGYIYFGISGDVMRCHQVCIQYDARRRLYGAALVGAVENIAIELSVSRIRLRCGFDLDANTFWRSLGYSCIRVEQGGVRRMRQINVWMKYMQPHLFEIEHIDPAKGKTDASVWRKNKRNGLVSQFVRGARMDEYRELVTGIRGTE